MIDDQYTVQVHVMQMETVAPAPVHLRTFFFDYLERVVEAYATGSAG